LNARHIARDDGHEPGRRPDQRRSNEDVGGDHRERAERGRRDDDDDDDDDDERRRCGLFKVNADEELLEKGDASDADVAVDAENGGNDAECDERAIEGGARARDEPGGGGGKRNGDDDGGTTKRNDDDDDESENRVREARRVALTATSRWWVV
jgi:hypothetical protein